MAPRTSTTIVIDMAHWRALKSFSTVVRSIENDPELEQFALMPVSCELVEVLMSIKAVVFSTNSLTNDAAVVAAAGVAKDFLRISEI